MTISDLHPSNSVDDAITRIAAARNADELEMAWIGGLREHQAPEERERILAAVGTRLAILGDLADDDLRMSWLRQAAEEPWLLDSPPQEGSLSPLVSKAVREAFVRVQDDLGDLRAALGNGTAALEYALSSPAAATRLRDLGRIVQRLRGNGLLALVQRDDVDLLANFAAGLTAGSTPVPVVPAALRVDRERLIRWASDSTAEGDLPRLVCSLIAETVPSVESLDMPGGTGVASPGWDGVVKCTSGNRFVPPGTSGWELSTIQRGAQRKAKEDYDKRVSSLSPADRADLTYVAVICAGWTKSRSFAKERAERGEFRAVHALNADDLESWLECAPATTVWLRELVGEPVSGITTLGNWWRDWLAGTRIPLDGPIVLAGRSSAADKLRDLSRHQRGGIITIGGSLARDEILAFVAASLVESDFAQSRAGALYVDERSELKRLLSAESIADPASVNTLGQGMTVVVPSAEFATDHPTDSIHQLIVPLLGSTRADIVLDAVDSGAVDQLLKAAGEDSCESAEYGALARMSLLTLRRRLSIKPEIHRPTWGTGQIDKALRRCLLLNSWSERSPGDCRIVERYVGRTHGEVRELLADIPHNDTPPLILTDERWYAVAPVDAWGLLRGQLTREDLEEFGDLALEVLREADPLYGLSHTERLVKLHDGVGTRYSKYLKEGVATTLALLGGHPPRLRGVLGAATSAADRIVAELLRAANDDPGPRTWISMVEQLPLLAEAAPDMLIGALRRCLTTSHPFAKAMFADVESDRFGFVPDSPHVNVLFALELLVWSTDHFHAAVDLLGHLTTLDPGGRLGNRPDNSLASIFCPWCPQTSANHEGRLEALDALRARHPSGAWNLMLTMLPQTMNTVPIKRGPRYRNWKSGEPFVTDGEWGETVASVSTRLVEDAKKDRERLATLAERIGELAINGRASLRLELLNVASSDANDELRCAVWPVLRREVASHRQFSDAEWALPESELAPFDELLERLRPADPVHVHGWWFDLGIPSVDGVPISDYKRFTTALHDRQVEAVLATLDGHGMPGVLRLAAKVARPDTVGEALAHCDASLNSEMLSALDSAEKPIRLMALGYFGQNFQEADWDHFEKIITETNPSARVTADLLRAMPRSTRPWSRADKFGDDVAEAYWARASQHDFAKVGEADELLEVSSRLRKANRPEAAVELLWFWTLSSEVDYQFAEETAACLEQLPVYRENPYRAVGGTESTALEKLLEVLDNHRDHIGVERITNIESSYFLTLRSRTEFGAPNLYRRMEREPEFFVSLVKLAFMPAGTSPGDFAESSDAERHRATVAYRLLRSWPSSGISPGVNKTGSVDKELLRQWTHRAREGLRESDRADIGDQMIGHALVATPPAADGGWPDEPVRELIEDIDSDALDTGIHVALLNQRDATSRGPTEGGGQESALAESYRKRAQEFRAWPRTAAIFQSLARDYGAQASWHNNDAEAHRRGLYP